MKKIVLLVFAMGLTFLLRAAVVDTVVIHSNAMNKDFKCVVIRPSATGKKSWPVVYLLHGYSGNYSNWIKMVPRLAEYADEYQLMIVCPDGGYGSWYFDSPIDPAMKYETYISKEVPGFIDAKYPTIKNRKGRAITGLSMGGHGGLFIGFRRSADFGACGSMSGGVDIRPFAKNWEISKRIGDSSRYPDNWRTYSVSTIIEKKPEKPLAIIFDCGTEDFFYKVNRELHEKMLRLKIPHEYIERPGKHDWAYWTNAVQYQLLFFSNYFR